MAESVPVPSGVVPSMKVTVPVGTVVFPEGPETVAVKVTLAPAVMVAADALSAVVLAAGAGGVVTDVQTAEFSKHCQAPAWLAYQHFRVAIPQEIGGRDCGGPLAQRQKRAGRGFRRHCRAEPRCSHSDCPQSHPGCRLC